MKVLELKWRSIILFVFLLNYQFLGAQKTEIHFRVKEYQSEQLLDSVLVIDNSNSILGYSQNGFLSITTSSIGFIDVKFKKYGYNDLIVNHIHLIPQKIIEVNIELKPFFEKIPEVGIIVHQSENNPSNPVSSFYFTREEINMNPGAQGDIFRAISMLPGVSSSGGIYSAISVRGQGVRDNVYMVDGIPCTELGHLEGNSFFNDPNGGRFSIFAPRVIEGAEFQSGGFSAQYGRRSASYLGLAVKSGNSNNLITDGQVDLLGFNINIEGPIKGIKNTTFFLSARYQNFLALVNVVGLRDIGLPRYGDFIFKTNTTLNSKLKLSTLFIAAPERYTRDTTHVNEDKNLNLVYMPDFQRNKAIAGVNLRYQPNRNFMWKNILYYTGYFSDIRVDKAIPNTDSLGIRRNWNLTVLERLQEQNYQEHKWGARSLLDITLKPKIELSLGLESDYTYLYNKRVQNENDTQFIYYRGQNFGPNKYLVLMPQFVNTQQEKRGYNHSAYLEARFKLLDNLQLNMGCRADYTGFSEQLVGAPRMSVAWRLNATNSLGIAIGRYFQDPIYSDIADQIKNNPLKMERTDMWVLSYKKGLGSSWKLRVEYWKKQFEDLIVRPQAGYTFVQNGGTGNGQGLDFHISKKLNNKIGGIVSYSIMESNRVDFLGGLSYPFAFDQTHQFNFLVNYKVNSRIFVSLKYRYATGKPSDAFIIHRNVLNNPNMFRYSKEITGINQTRLPSFRSLDIRFNYDFRVRNVAFTGFMDIVNVANKQISNFENFNAYRGQAYFDGLAIFPTGGLKFEF